AIPRGGESLIRRVAAEATMPVLKHYLGNCHVYVDRAADLEMAERIVINAKCQRPGCATRWRGFWSTPTWRPHSAVGSGRVCGSAGGSPAADKSLDFPYLPLSRRPTPTSRLNSAIWSCR